MDDKILGAYENLLEKFILLASNEENIRLVFIVGSRARKNCPADEWSDLDLVIAANNPEDLLNKTEWLNYIGIPRITFLERTAVGGGLERRVLFDGGLDVDFAIFPVQLISHLGNNPESMKVLSRGFKIVLDKDNLMKDLSLPTEDTVPHPKPREKDFINLINDFWYHSVWTAKKLRRGELLEAKLCCDIYMKNLLFQVLRWYTYATKGWNYDTWHEARFFEKWVDSSILAEMERIYAHYEGEDIWNALFSTIDLFRRLSKETSALLDYQYPTDADNYASTFVMFLYRDKLSQDS